MTTRVDQFSLSVIRMMILLELEIRKELGKAPFYFLYLRSTKEL